MSVPYLKEKPGITVILPDVLSKQIQEEVLKNATPLLKASDTYFERTLFSLFQFDSNSQLPVAAITALAGGLPANPGGWLRADPVEMVVDRGNAYCAGSTHLHITAVERAALQTLLNNFLREDGLQLHIIGNYEWCLQLSTKPNIITYTPSQIIGKQVRDYLPQGENAKKWQTLLTEIQMLLYESPVNRERASHGQPLISSLWFWGEGDLPKTKRLARWKQIWSKRLLMKGLGILTNTKVEEKLPANFDECLTLMDKSGEYLVDLMESQTPEEIKNHWLTPILMALDAKKLISVNLCLADGSLYNIRRRSWWQRFGKKSIFKIFKRSILSS
jgi:hypothetical protein